MATLELARAFHDSSLSTSTKHQIRFAWWTGEELGLLGSYFYVSDLKHNAPDVLRAHKLTVDTDMIASTNYVRGVWDGSQLPDEKLRAACKLVQDVFEQYFAKRGLPTTPFYFNGRSDFAAFLENGIPSSGVITGEDEIKTAAGVAAFGGIQGMVLDPCYHQDCDNTERLASGPGFEILSQNLDALANALSYFATQDLQTLDTLLN